MENLIRMPISNEKEIRLNAFLEDIHKLCKGLSHEIYADYGAIVLDLLIVYKGFRICAVRYAPNKLHLKYEIDRMPSILKGAMIPIGVVVDKKGDCNVFRNGKLRGKKMSIDDLSKLINNTCSFLSLQPDIDKMKTLLLRIFKRAKFKNKKDCKEIFEKACSNLEIRNGFVRMPETIENEFFSVLLGGIKSSCVCRYISLKSLFGILNEQRITMCTPMSMNDSSEGEYADSMMPYYVKIDKNEEVIESENSIYMLSCCEMDVYDDLALWRLYGDDTKGVCVKYNIDFSKIDNQRFFVAPVNYADKDGHPELYFIRDIMNAKLDNGWHFRFNNWYFWQYFFKPYEYSYEKEVRLLYFPTSDIELQKVTWYMDSTNGIFNRKIEVPIDYDDKFKFPLVMESIVLGPNSPQSNVNQNQIYFMANTCGVNSNNYIMVEKSQINNYR